MVLRKVLVAALIGVGAAGMAIAKDDGDRRERHVRMHGPHGAMSIERMALRNVMVDLLSARTGKTAGEVRAAFEDAHPHEAMRSLGIGDDEMKPLFQEAHATLATRAAAAGLITAEQAEQVKKAKIEMRFRKKRGADDGHDDHH